MTIEIWSDIVCPFCYIGKVKLEAALRQFNREGIEITWKSYQLMPEMITQPGKGVDKMLAETKGISLEQARQMQTQVTHMARQAGLVYHLEKAVTANTFRAHQLLHFAKAGGKQNAAEELLFKAYFTEGKNIDDLPTLLELGNSLGLDAAALQTALEEETYAGAVRKDIQEAQEIGVRGVPFFVFDRKYAVSGAQDPQVYLQALQQSFSERAKEQPGRAEDADGAACRADGACD